ncbi:MAG: ribonuclease D, partial [Actinomycetia bacterium]|nr:ribonuclease D [Actinomycetes bacterium]
MLSSPTKAAWLVQTDAELAQAIRQLAGASVLAIDTEFLREKTYRAQLCLLQLASAEQALLIDPLAGLDLRPLGELLWSPAILKVLHAGYQDLEILLQALGQPVAPIFDTQLAAAVLGLPQQVSLAVLVKHYTGVELAKIDTFSDWSKRPLRVDQLGYALDDVRYLPQIHDQMQEELRVWGRESWLADEFQTLARAEHFSEQPDDLWRRLKGSNGLSRRQLAVLRELAVWRDAAARQ